MKYGLKFKVKNNNKHLIVFIHGLFGGEETWQTTDHNTLMDYFISSPELLSKFDIALFDYYSSPIEKLFNNNKIELILSKIGIKRRTRKIISIKDTSKILSNELKYKSTNYDGLILIGHSMGGLVSKYYITSNLNAQLSLNIKLFISLAVPHNGSKTADLARVFFGSQQISGLQTFDSERYDLNQEWVQAGQSLPRTIYFEGKSDDIVGPQSSVAFDSRKTNIEVIPVDHSHFSIVRPESEEDLVVVATIKECLIATEVSDNVHTANDIPALKTNTQRVIEQYEKKEIDLYNNKLKELINNDIKDVNFFERKFSLKNTEEYQIQEVIQEISGSEYSVLYGIGGLGKSIICRIIILELLKILTNPVIIFCDGKRLENNYFKSGVTNDFEQEFKDLLEAFDCIIDFNYIKRVKLDRVNHSLNKYIFLDGFNEISSETSRLNVLKTLKTAHHRYGFKIVLITRNYDINEFKRFTGFGIEKIGSKQLEFILKSSFNKSLSDYSDKNIEYLSIPFFLDIAIKSGRDIISNYSDYISSHVLQSLASRDHVNATKELSNLAFNAFNSSKKFLISKSSMTFKKRDDYVESKILTEDGDYYKFEHQLINEYFIAYKIANNKEYWTNEIYDRITFEDKSSFEVIQMIFEQIGDESAANEFLESVYDWNFYAVLHSLVTTPQKVSDELAKALILILTEKLFDNFYHTRNRISQNLIQLLKIYPIKGLTPKQVKTISEGNDGVYKECFYQILQNNEDAFKNSKYFNWYQLFSINNQDISDENIRIIVKDNSILGWSISNVLKRNRLEDNQIELLIRLYGESSNYMHKWRIVHALGGNGSERTLNFLFETLVARDNIWISYGSIRSILEIGLFYSTVDVFSSILEKLFSILSEVELSKIVVSELRACLINEIELRKYSLIKGFLENCISSSAINFSDKDLFEISLKKLIEKNEKSS